MSNNQYVAGLLRTNHSLLFEDTACIAFSMKVAKAVVSGIMMWRGLFSVKHVVKSFS